MKNIFTIMKKELKRFFTDRRMLMSLLLPGLMIFIVYSLMGSFIQDIVKTDDEFVYQIKVFNNQDEFDLKEIASLQNYKVNITEYNNDEKLEEEKENLHDNVDITALIIYYSSDFNVDNMNSKVSIYYNSTSNASSQIYQFYYSYLFSQSSTPKFGVNSDLSVKYDVATTEDTSKQFVSMLLPFLLIALLFSGCLAVSTESIAGEKERGTIATLLITPTKRSHIAIGKIFALSITAIVSALTSFIGLIASFPRLMGEVDFNVSMYGVEHYLGLLGIIMVLVLLFICLLSIISTFAKSVKEATSYSVPLMILVMLLGGSSLMGMGAVQENTLLYLIPIYNAIQCMSGILSLKFNLVNFLLTIVSNLTLFGIGIIVLIKMFNSERIMYNK